MFGKEVVEFSRNLESLRDFIELVDAHLDEKNKDELREDPSSFAPLMLIMHKEHPEEFDFDDETLNKLMDRFGSNIELVEKEAEEGKKVEIKMDEEGQKKFSTAMEKITKSQQRKSSLHQSSLVTIISYVEWFLAQLIHKYYDKNPKAVGLKDKQLSLNDLYEIGSIEDAKKYLTDTKVESVLRGSFNDWIKFLREQMSLSMGYLKDHENVLIEACQRRNLYVHNGGIVNSIYLKNCSFESSKQPGLGDRLTCEGDYIEEVLSAFEKVFLLIAAELWKKNEPVSEKRFSILNGMSYEHICEGRYEIASSLAFFLWGDKGQNESNRMTAQINYWQAKKWQGEFSSVKKEIEKTDFSAKDTLFILAKHTLLDEFDEAFKILPGILSSEKLSYEDLEEWPLFQGLRENPKYMDIKLQYEPELQPDDAHDTEKVH